uniref:Reverse transcriptase zinc-binding domain-containing protein n=1 Tax=Lactuca sativa TaxID=4236 RepID=A0A9R1WBQ0_LACSA|nr:hypothetical protein LSAT_V11C300110260 [Lactuca sativa]
MVYLESIICRCFWGGSSDKNKIPWVAWKKVLNSRDDGGLGIGSLTAFNYVLLAKWWWRFRNDNRGIWHDVIMSLHGTDGGIGRTRVVARIGGTWDNKWKWIKDNEGYFTVASYRKTIDNHLLICLEDNTPWNKILLGNSLGRCMLPSTIGGIRVRWIAALSMTSSAVCPVLVPLGV